MRPPFRQTVRDLCGLAFVLGAALWWLYFDTAGAATTSSLRDAMDNEGEDAAEDEEESTSAFDFHLYGQLPATLGLLVAGVGIEHAVAEAGKDALPWATLLPMCAGIALYLLALAGTQAALRRAGVIPAPGRWRDARARPLPPKVGQRSTWARLAVQLMHVVVELLLPRNIQGQRSTRMTVVLSSSPDNGEDPMVLAESERTLNRNHPGVRGRLHVGIQVMFSDTQEQGVVRGDNLYVGVDGEYRTNRLARGRVQQLSLHHEQMIARHWICRNEYMACRVASVQAEWHGCPPCGTVELPGVKLAILVAYTVAFIPVMASVVIAVLAG